MTTDPKLVEPTRSIPQTAPDGDGTLRTKGMLSPKLNTTRSRVAVPPSKVIPIIVIPGIMGTNLCAAKTGIAKDSPLKPGQPAWRPPNGSLAGLREAGEWATREPKTRQDVLDHLSLEVDRSGMISLGPSPEAVLDVTEARKRGWGEIHWASYGSLLIALQRRMNATFHIAMEMRMVAPHWIRVNRCDRARWNVADTGLMTPISDAEFEKVSEFHYPVYAFGYNWLESNERSSKLLEARINEIISRWSVPGSFCKQVILVTHSMGGLVGRACAKRIPSKIAGVVHGVMPALGAPVCYRRIACGTERWGPSNGKLDNIAAEKFSQIAGSLTYQTTPVMATAPGPLELLPTHLYPGPWLFASVRGEDILKLPVGNPYDLYRDMQSWYRLIDPTIADPAAKFESTGGVKKAIYLAIDQAERFHRDVLGDYYHPNTFAFYGADPNHRSFGTCRWIVRYAGGDFQSKTLRDAKIVEGYNNRRTVETQDGRRLDFLMSDQDVSGDGTVPAQSGAGPTGKVRGIYRTKGFDHQGSYSDEAMVLLTQHLLVRVIQGIK